MASSLCPLASGSPISAGTQHQCHIQAAEKVEGLRKWRKVALSRWQECFGERKKPLL
ncbi:hypothetical protein ENTCAN_05655 [Enterobacter cancerogenus ATCC 35316]|nr:hypothetical protein ENTCAN_05655 [Enterobacter cancerogenus ATCC 35316]